MYLLLPNDPEPNKTWLATLRAAAVPQWNSAQPQPVGCQRSNVLLNKQILTIVSLALMKSIILAVLCFLALPLIAQNALVPDPVPPQRSPRGELQSLGESKTFKENITIRLYGTTTTGNDIDLSLSGIGPSFTADQVLNDDTMLTCKYVVSETETGYKVSYSVGVSIKVPTSSTDFGYREFSISGTVLCNVDRPQVLVRYGSKPLQLTITKEAEQ